MQNDLVAACERGDVKQARMLVSAGADVNARGLNKMRSLTYPVTAAGGSENGTELLGVLIELGANLATPDGYSIVGDRAMTAALCAGNVTTVRFLRGKGIAAGSDALVAQCLFGTQKSIAFCLEQGCAPEKPALVGSKATVLHALAEGDVKGAAEVAEDMIARGALIEARDAYDRTPLYLAAASGRDDVLRVYLTHGADRAAVCRGKSIARVAKNQTIRKLLAGGATPPKATAKRPLRATEVEAIYAAYAGNFFEGPWMGDAGLERALFAFAREHHATLADTAGEDAVALEQLLRDEEGPETIAAFLGSLPVARLKSACAAIAEAIEEMSETGAKKWVKKLRAI